MSDEDDVVIGIDLGTTNSCVAVYTNGETKVLNNNEGKRITPSFLYFKKAKVATVGHNAKRMAEEGKAEYAIYGVKRLIGRKFDDAEIQDTLQYLSYEVECPNNEPVVVMRKSSKKFRKTPIELTTLILAKIKTDVENELGKGHGSKAVITVPAYFNVNQREDTLEAAYKAGFTVLKLLNEPTAAAFKFCLENPCKIDDYFLIYDLGGGSFDVAILKQTADNIEVVGVDGVNHLGGQDFDNLILDYVCKILQEDYNIDLKSEKDKKSLLRIRNACSLAKIELSYVDNTDIVLEGLTSTHNRILIDLTRHQFEEMANDLFRETINVAVNCLESCKLSKENIKKVILSGAATRIPKIQNMVRDYFGDNLVYSFFRPEACVAEGAAIQAAMLSRNPIQKIDVIKITDVTSLSLGIGTTASLMAFYIKRNTPIPATATIDFTTIQHQQEYLKIDVYEGERTDARKNRHLGSFILNNLTPAPPSTCIVSISMNIDQNGILKVTAQEKNKNNVKCLKIAFSRGHISDAEVKNAVKDAENNKIEDERFVKFALQKRYLMDYCAAAIYNIIKKDLEKLDKNIYKLCLKMYEKAEKMEMDDEVKLKKLRKQVESKFEIFVKYYKFEFMPIQIQ